MPIYIMYANRLISVQDAGSLYSHAAKTIVFSELKRIKKFVSSADSLDAPTTAHHEYGINLVHNMLKGEIKISGSSEN